MIKILSLKVNYLDAYDVYFCCFQTFLKEPDVGMPEKDAHRFFLQLISAVVGEAHLCDEESPLPISPIT